MFKASSEEVEGPFASDHCLLVYRWAGVFHSKEQRGGKHRQHWSPHASLLQLIVPFVVERKQLWPPGVGTCIFCHFIWAEEKRSVILPALFPFYSIQATDLFIGATHT